MVPTMTTQNLTWEEWEKLTINDLKLNVRAANCLHNGNVTTIQHLCDIIESGFIIGYRNLGMKSILEIVNKLKEKGVTVNNDRIERFRVQQAQKTTKVVFYLKGEQSDDDWVSVTLGGINLQNVPNFKQQLRDLGYSLKTKP